MSPYVIVETMNVPPQPWRNGHGHTRELFAWPHAADWRVRISVADIGADAPFSSFPGVQRWFVVLKGSGVELDIDGTTHRQTRLDAPLCFDGGSAVACRLIDGPTQDLNLMLRGGQQGGIWVAQDGAAWRPEGTACGLYTAIAGRCLADRQAIELPAYALLWFEHAPGLLAFRAGGRPAGATGWWLAAS
jgi:environmental stress-induced protein Ves